MRIITLAALLFAAEAHAARHFSVQIALAPYAEAEVDEFEAGGQTSNGDDEDLDGNIGLLVTADWELGLPGLRLGARFGLMSADGDDTKAEYLTVAPGAQARYVFLPGNIAPFAGAGAGLTYAAVEPDGVDDDLTGIGWHFFLAGGVEYEFNDQLGAIVTLTYIRHAVSVEGEINNVDYEYKDGVLSRLLFSAGVTFL